MLYKARFVIGGALVVLMSALASYFAASAASPGAFLPSGSIRLAVASSAVTVTTDSATFENISGMSRSITIPAGKNGDIVIVFCGDALATGGVLHVRGMVGGAATLPGYSLLREPSTAYENNCTVFVRTGVGGGTKTVRVQWRSGFGDVYLGQRTMLVIANIR